MLTEPLSCGQCGRPFRRRDHLRQHLKTHAPERITFRCPRPGCSRTYTTLFNLQSHILAFHEESRPFVCQHAGCGKAFAMKVCVPLGLRHPVRVPGSTRGWDRPTQPWPRVP